MSIVPLADIVIFLGNDAGFSSTDLGDNDPEIVLAPIHLAVEKWIQETYCFREFELQEHKEFYHGEGNTKLFLKNFPVSSITMLATDRQDAIRIKNTTTVSYASVNADGSSLILNLNGTKSTLSFTTYTTLTTLVDAINALGSGWTATLTNTSMASFASSLIFEVYGLNCINSQYVYLQIPDELEYDFKVHKDRGIIENSFGFPKGWNNIFVWYDAGYSAADMPDDLKLAVKILVQAVFQKQDERAFNLDSYSVGGISLGFEQFGIPREAKLILDSGYKRWKL
mgnify:CR=1 FL=1